jgi:imidazolonepropionase-like amidohydrolase
MRTHFVSAPAALFALAALNGVLSAPLLAATLIEHADVYAVSAPMQANTAVLIDGGKIVAIGAAASARGTDATRIDATGLRLYPGLISAHSSLGLLEVEAIRASVDTAEVGAINPNVRAQIAVHADSALIPVARGGGVLSVLATPAAGNGGLIAGQSALMNMAGWTYEEMTVKASVAMHLYWPSTRLPPWLPKPMIAQAEKAATENLAALEETFTQAKAYRAKAAQSGQPQDLRLAALLPVLSREQPLFIHADDVTQLRSALAFCTRQTLRCTLVGGLDAWRMVAEIKAANVAVILGSPYNNPTRRSEGFDAIYSAAAKLAAANVPFAIAGDGGGMAASLEKNLAYLAAQSAAFGLAPEQALRAITLSPAEILGVEKRLGSIEVGKDANLLLVQGDILEIASPIKRIFIAGVDTPLTSHHTELCQRYQARYRTNAEASVPSACAVP